jgi:hypothetical protein
MWGVRGRGGGRLREGEGDVKTNDAYLTVIHSIPLCVCRLSPCHCLNPKPLNPQTLPLPRARTHRVPPSNQITRLGDMHTTLRCLVSLLNPTP